MKPALDHPESPHFPAHLFLFCRRCHTVGQNNPDQYGIFRMVVRRGIATSGHKDGVKSRVAAWNPMWRANDSAAGYHQFSTLYTDARLCRAAVQQAYRFQFAVPAPYGRRSELAGSVPLPDIPATRISETDGASVQAPICRGGCNPVVRQDWERRRALYRSLRRASHG